MDDLFSVNPSYLNLKQFIQFVKNRRKQEIVHKKIVSGAAAWIEQVFQEKQMIRELFAILSPKIEPKEEPSKDPFENL